MKTCLVWFSVTGLLLCINHSVICIHFTHNLLTAFRWIIYLYINRGAKDPVLSLVVHPIYNLPFTNYSVLCCDIVWLVDVSCSFSVCILIICTIHFIRHVILLLLVILVKGCLFNIWPGTTNSGSFTALFSVDWNGAPDLKIGVITAVLWKHLLCCSSSCSVLLF